mmetsp:Transcript_1293/g.1801  ORF Transcript_1293/g.1801 Transcript_1293/m.1801 type:complete len:249 (-) Transcript_1293:204-950(-)
MRVICPSCKTELEAPNDVEYFTCGNCGQTLRNQQYLQGQQQQLGVPHHQVQADAPGEIIGEVGVIEGVVSAEPLAEVIEDDDGNASLLANNNQWVATTCSCFDEPLICCYGCCCGLCMFCELGFDVYDDIGNEGWHFLPNLCGSCILSYPYCAICTCICCPQYYSCCFQGHILARFRNKYNLPTLPEGEGFSGPRGSQWCFADCVQMLPCWGSCTLCLMYRQRKAMNYRGAEGRGEYTLQFVENNAMA